MPQINTRITVFVMQMKWFRQAGYRTINLSELLGGFETGQDLSKKFVLTFDDGYQDFYSDAFPLVRQCGFIATVFPATDCIRDTAVRVEGADCLTWSEVRELHAQGITFGSHSVTHADLRSLGAEQIDYELGYSKETIEDRIGAPVESFSYPFALPEEDGDFIRYLADILIRWKTWVIRMMFPRPSGGPRRRTLDSSCLGYPSIPGTTWSYFGQRSRGVRLAPLAYKFAHHNVALMTGHSIKGIKSALGNQVLGPSHYLHL